MEENSNQGLATACESNKRTCRHCGQPIALTANICHLCKKYQNRNGSLLAQLSNLPNILSIGILVLSLMQFNEARKKTAEANDALDKANAANVRAQKIESDVKTIKADIDKTATVLKAVAKATIENYAIMSSYTYTVGLSKPAKMRIDKNDNLLSEFAEPDKAARVKWIHSIMKLYNKGTTP